MKKTMVILCTILLGFGVASNAYALDVNDDGYAYKQASTAERLKVCKHLERVLGKNSFAWLGFLNSFYDTGNAGILGIRISEAAAMGKVLSDKGQLDF
jgi:hypothetical protein